MGAFFSTIHIKNQKQVNIEEFTKLICKFIEKNGLISTDAENAQFTYYLAFSENSDWVTMSSPVNPVPLR